MADSARTRIGPARTGVLALGPVHLTLAVAGMATQRPGEFGWEAPVRPLGVLGASTLLDAVHGVVGAVAPLSAHRAESGPAVS